MNETTPKLSRRRVFAGAGAAGAVAAAAVAVPALRQAEPGASGAKPDTDKAEGYRETQHVLRYYQTTRI